jgi:hypothetical protein
MQLNCNPATGLCTIITNKPDGTNCKSMRLAAYEAC